MVHWLDELVGELNASPDGAEVGWWAHGFGADHWWAAGMVGVVLDVDVASPDGDAAIYLAVPWAPVDSWSDASPATGLTRRLRADPDLWVWAVLESDLGDDLRWRQVAVAPVGESPSDYDLGRLDAYLDRSGGGWVRGLGAFSPDAVSARLDRWWQEVGGGIGLHFVWRPELQPGTQPEEIRFGRISMHPNYLVGKPRIAGTRIGVEVIVNILDGGQSPEEIVADYPTLTLDDVDEALFFHAHVGAERFGRELRPFIEEESGWTVVELRLPPGQSLDDWAEEFFSSQRHTGGA